MILNLSESYYGRVSHIKISSLNLNWLCCSESIFTKQPNFGTVFWPTVQHGHLEMSWLSGYWVFQQRRHNWIVDWMCKCSASTCRCLAGGSWLAAIWFSAVRFAKFSLKEVLISKYQQSFVNQTNWNDQTYNELSSELALWIAIGGTWETAEGRDICGGGAAVWLWKCYLPLAVAGNISIFSTPQ